MGRYQICSKETIKVLSGAVERHHPLQYTPTAYCIPKAIGMEIAKIINDYVYESLRTLPMISFKDNRSKELGSEVSGQAESSQPSPNPIHRTKRLVVIELTSRSSAQEIDTRNLLTARIPICLLTERQRHRQRRRSRKNKRPVGGHWSPQLEEMDIDLIVSGLPHAVVKQTENSRRLELVKKILIEKIFKPIFNKTMLTTHLVKHQRR